MHAYPLVLVTNGLRSFVARESETGFVAQRFKRMDRIVNKLGRMPRLRLSQMEDIGGCRAIVENAREVSAIVRRMRNARWNIVGVNDYSRVPKPDGYRARHIIVRRENRLIEIQLRTPTQHEWAEAVERAAGQTGHNVKDGEAPRELLAYFECAARFLAVQEQGGPVDDALIAELDELHAETAHYWNNQA